MKKLLLTALFVPAICFADNVNVVAPNIDINNLQKVEITDKGVTLSGHTGNNYQSYTIKYPEGNTTIITQEFDSSTLENKIDNNSENINNLWSYYENSNNKMDSFINKSQEDINKMFMSYNKSMKDMNNKIDKIDKRVNKLENKVNGLGASLSAIAGLHYQAMKQGEGQIAAAIGGYEGNQSIAVGFAYQGTKTIAFNGSVACGNSETVWSVGGSFKW